jgi:hypothetical protein
MTAAMASLRKHRNTVLIDIGLVAALYLLPGISHVTAFPFYMYEPMRIGLIIALLFTNRANAFLIAFTLPFASFLISGHPAPFKALLMGIELSALAAGYFYFLKTLRIPAFAALTAAILLSKLLYYTLKYAALGAGLLGGSLVSTPLQTQLVLGIGTAAVFGLLETYRAKSTRKH